MIRTSALVLTLAGSIGCTTTPRPSEPSPVDTSSPQDTSTPPDTSSVDTSVDTSVQQDTSSPQDTSTPADTSSTTPESILPGDSCFGAPTVSTGAYTGTLSYNLNEFSSTPSCANVPVAGRDGVVIVELLAGQTLDARYLTRGGDAVLFLLDTCPVLSSCLVARDASSGDTESLQWTNSGSETNTVYLVMDHAEMGQGMRFDLDITVQ